MEILKFLQSLPSGEITLSVLLLATLVWIIKFIWKEFKKITKEHEDRILRIQVDHEAKLQKWQEQCRVDTNRLHEDNKEEQKNIIKEMFETINKNTESHTKLAEAVRDLGHKIR